MIHLPLARCWPSQFSVSSLPTSALSKTGCSLHSVGHSLTHIFSCFMWTKEVFVTVTWEREKWVPAFVLKIWHSRRVGTTSPWSPERSCILERQPYLLYCFLWTWWLNPWAQGWLLQWGDWNPQLQKFLTPFLPQDELNSPGSPC